MNTKGFHRNFIFPLFSLAALGGVSACSHWPGYPVQSEGEATLAEASRLVVTGSATYRERMMAPPGAVLNVTLSDTSRADAPAVRMAAWSTALDGKSVPQSFTLIPNAALDPRMTYTVRATVNGPGGALLWTTDTAHIVDVSGAGAVDMGELVMVKVAAPQAAEPAGIDPDLVTGDWVIKSIGGAPVIGERPLTLRLGADGRASGYAGCNTFSGSFKHTASGLHFGPMAMTMMACMEDGLNVQESRLGGALKGAAAVSLDGGVMTLSGAEGVGITLERPPAPPALAGSAWKVTMMGGTAIVSGREPTLAFGTDGRVTGSGGCNSYFGEYVQDGATLTVSALGATKMMCGGDGVMQQESAYTDILAGISALTLGDDGNRLTVKGEDGVSFTGERIVADAPPADPAVLPGGEWVVEDINRTGVIDNSRLTLAFGADGRVTGSTNCNSLSGTYTVDGGKLILSPLAMTRRACLAPALSNQETKYVAALNGALDWKITSDGALELTGDEGRRILLRR